MSPSAAQTSYVDEGKQLEAWMTGRTARPVANRGSGPEASRAPTAPRTARSPHRPLGRPSMSPAPAAVARATAEPQDPRVFEVVFLPADHRVGQMRRIMRAQLRYWDLMALADDAALSVTELVTNAVRHGEGRPVGLRVRCFADELRIEVTDGSPTRARMRSADATDQNGRGLFLVSAVSKEWGVSSDGTMTWCSLAIPGGGA
ncbi:ATP-binding protein [Streptomyces sp. NPDC001107]